MSIRGLTDERRRELAQRWRDAADRLEAETHEPQSARIAAAWRRDADVLEGHDERVEVAGRHDADLLGGGPNA